MTQLPEIDISPLALISAAWLCLISNISFLSAAVLPVFIHEAAHIAAMRLFGMKINALRLEFSGLCLDYSGYYSYFGQFITALVGPAAGIIYAYGASALSVCFASSLLSLSAGISLLFSLFNLIPALPLDGGRMLEAVLGQYGKSTVKYISICVAALITLCGGYLMYNQKGAALFIVGCVIILYNIKNIME